MSVSAVITEGNPFPLKLPSARNEDSEFPVYT